MKKIAFKEKNIKESLGAAMKGGYPFYKLLIAYFVFLIGNIFINEYKITEFAFFVHTSIGIVILGTIFLWLLLLFALKDSWTLPALAFVLSFYSYICIKQNHDYYFLCGCLIVISLFVCCMKFEKISIWVSEEFAWLSILGIALLLTGIVSTVCVIIYRNNGTSCFDFGIFAQMYYYMKETGLPLTTCERDGLLSHFAVHISPVYYLLLPIYFLSPKPETLLILQCVVTFSGVIPLYLICKNHKISRMASIAFAICFVLVPSFTGGCYYYFHENNFLPPMLLWLVYFFEIRDVKINIKKWGILSKVIFWVLVFLSLGIKEDAAIYVAVVALYFLILDCKKYASRKSWKEIWKSNSLWTLLLAIAYFVVAVIILSTSGDGAMTGRYNNYIYDGSGSLAVMLIGLLKNPVYVVTQCMTVDKIQFLFYMIVPLALLPLLCPDVENWILMIPLLLINVMPNYGYQQSIFYQYAFGSGALLVYLSVLNYEKLGKNRKKILLLAVIASSLSYGFHFGGRLQNYWNAYRENEEYRKNIDLAAEKIPDEAYLASATFLLPYFSQRMQVYELETTQTICEYYAVDLRGGVSVEEKYLNADVYEEIIKIDGAIAIYRLRNWQEGMYSPQKEFSIRVHAFRDDMEQYIQESLKQCSIEELGDILYNGITVKRVTGDQHWTEPSQDGGMEAVYMVDSYGVLVYISYKDENFIATWSGPTKDEALMEAEYGWSGGNGAGWTGMA